MGATAIPISGILNPRKHFHLPPFPSTPNFPPQISPCRPTSPYRQLFHVKAGQLRRNLIKPAKASDSPNPSPSSDTAERWLLEPIGDGDFKHIGYRVPMPDAFEIASSSVMVGRLPEKANIVIPVATVSGLHARLEKKSGVLLVTDLDSTNGTYINEKRLKPGSATPIPPGSALIFGDIHLAMFRVSKLEGVDLQSKPNEFETKAEADSPTIDSKIES
ncbi:hypothetical protein ACLOJK_025041 [Asimina triloba]